MKRSYVLDCLFGAPAKMRASPKDYDPNMNQERLSWEVHAASCEHIGNFNTYYHMSQLQFETMYAMVGATLERCPIKAKNSAFLRGQCSRRRNKEQARAKQECGDHSPELSISGH